MFELRTVGKVCHTFLSIPPIQTNGTECIDHVGREAFIRALSDGPLQLEVLRGEPETLEEHRHDIRGI